MSQLSTRGGLLLVIGASALVLTLAAVDLTRDRLPTDSFIRSPSGQEFYAYLPIKDRVRLPVPRGEKGLIFSAGSVGGKPTNLLGLSNSATTKRLFSWDLTSRVGSPGSDLSLEPSNPIDFRFEGAVRSFTVGRWDTSSRNLILARLSSGRVEVFRLDLEQPNSTNGVPSSVGSTPALPPLPEGATRSVSLVQSGPRPDLYVADGMPNLTWRIMAFSGKRGYGDSVFTRRTVKVVSGNLTSRGWQSTVARLGSGDPADLVLLTTSPRSGSSFTELHVLLGRSEFRRFLIRIPTERSRSDLSPRETRSLLVTSAEGARPGFFGVAELISNRNGYRLLWLPFSYR